ncbi:hypothetical protein VPH35_028581 [Triticum aestivum]
MDEDDHHGTHVVEFAIAYSGAVLNQGPPPQQILAWFVDTCRLVVSDFATDVIVHIDEVRFYLHKHVVLQTQNVQLSGSLCHAIKIMGSPIICCSKSDKSEEECARSNSIINGKLNKMNHTGEEPPRRNNSSVQVEPLVSMRYCYVLAVAPYYQLDKFKMKDGEGVAEMYSRLALITNEITYLNPSSVNFGKIWT